MDDKRFANLQAQLNLLAEQLQGMEELVIHLLQQKARARDPMRWRTPEMAKA